MTTGNFAPAAGGAMILNYGESDAVAASLSLGTGTKTATATGGAATLNKSSGKITTEALTTASGGFYTLTLTNSVIAAGDLVFATVGDGTNTSNSSLGIEHCDVTNGSVVTRVRNWGPAAYNGTLVIGFMVLKA